MKVLSVRYELKKSLGQYENETLSCELEPTVGNEDSESADTLMAEARRVCVQHSTEYLKKRERA